MVAVAKFIFPKPPLPPLSITSLLFSPDISAMTLPDSKSFITVPSGTFIIRFLASAPWHLLLPPGSPSPATYFLFILKSVRVLRPSSTSKMISPPFPPSPPSGPPAATKSSLLKLTWPSPPLPDFIKIFALSANINTSF